MKNFTKGMPSTWGADGKIVVEVGSSSHSPRASTTTVVDNPVDPCHLFVPYIGAGHDTWHESGSEFGVSVCHIDESW